MLELEESQSLPKFMNAVQFNSGDIVATIYRIEGEFPVTLMIAEAELAFPQNSKNRGTVHAR